MTGEDCRRIREDIEKVAEITEEAKKDIKLYARLLSEEDMKNEAEPDAAPQEKKNDDYDDGN